MSNVKKQQEEAMACIDTAKAIVDKIATIIELAVANVPLSDIYASGSIGFQLQILKHLGIKFDEIKVWLTDFLVLVLPSLEISVKAILLTNLKNMISCSIDPRIPDKYRKQHKIPKDYNSSQEYGIDINIESIDFLDKLSVNPLSEYGNTLYFGLEGVEDSYKFARADDMDAFLWFVIHKGKFPNSSLIDSIDDFTSDIHSARAQSVTPSDGSLLSALEVTYSSDSPSSILQGNTFQYEKSSHVISMCYDRVFDTNNNIVHNTLVPVSDDWSSVNWYTRSRDQLWKNIGMGWWPDQKSGETKYKGKGRNFSKERAICNLQYIDQASSDAPLTGMVNNKFRFTILPKPTVHIPNLSEGEPPWRFKKLLFNEKGEYDSNGKYTLAEEPYSSKMEYCDGNVTIDPKSGNVTVSDKNEVVKNLMECYPGLTVYEFNYDYVMSIKLFDAKVLATALIDSLLNTNIELNASFSQRYQEGYETIKEIIKSIIETEDSEINDCYYSFDNSKYEELLRKSEEKRARQERFGNVTHEVNGFESVRQILEEYDANAKLEKQIDVLHRVITQASVIVSEGVDDTEKYGIEYDFVFDLIEMLVTAIVNSILSPKVLMLLTVNQKLMGGTWEKFTMKDLISAMRSIIVSIIKEIKDLVLQELIKLILNKLQPILETISSLILKEQMESYLDAITEIIRNCPFIWFSIGNRYVDTKLDTVDYADIDTTITTATEQPSTNNC